MPYQEQLAVKQGEIEALFGTAEAIVGGEPWRYRGKMEFSFSQDKKGTKYLGLVMPKSRGRVFQLTECHIAPPLDG